MGGIFVKTRKSIHGNKLIIHTLTITKSQKKTKRKKIK